MHRRQRAKLQRQHRWRRCKLPREEQATSWRPTQPSQSSCAPSLKLLSRIYILTEGRRFSLPTIKGRFYGLGLARSTPSTGQAYFCRTSSGIPAAVGPAGGDCAGRIKGAEFRTEQGLWWPLAPCSGVSLVPIGRRDHSFGPLPSACSRPAQQVRQLRNVGRNASRLVACEPVHSHPTRVLHCVQVLSALLCGGG